VAVRSAAVVIALITAALGSCADPLRTTGSPARTPLPLAMFQGRVQCAEGEEDGAAGWDYGANPRGTIEDPVAWVRESAVGLDPALELTFDEQVRGDVDSLHNVVLATNRQGSVVAFVEFGRDDEGRYFPNYAEMCASAGIEEFR